MGGRGGRQLSGGLRVEDVEEEGWELFCVVCEHDEQSHLAVEVENQATCIARLGVLFVSDVSVLLSL